MAVGTGVLTATADVEAVGRAGLGLVHRSGICTHYTVCTRTHARTHAHTHTHACTHTHARTYTHTHTHTTHIRGEEERLTTLQLHSNPSPWQHEASGRPVPRTPQTWPRGCRWRLDHRLGCVPGARLWDDSGISCATQTHCQMSS